MIRVYFLPVETVSGTEQVAGIEFIHDALLECTELPGIHKLTMNTTDDEDAGLEAAAGMARAASPEEINHFNALVVAVVANPDVERARELLATSPAVITMPEIWELLRIIGHQFGWYD